VFRGTGVYPRKRVPFWVGGTREPVTEVTAASALACRAWTARAADAGLRARTAPGSTCLAPFDRRAVAQEHFVDTPQHRGAPGRGVRVSRPPRSRASVAGEDWEFVWRLSRPSRRVVLASREARLRCWEIAARPWPGGASSANTYPLCGSVGLASCGLSHERGWLFRRHGQHRIHQKGKLVSAPKCTTRVGTGAVGDR